MSFDWESKSIEEQTRFALEWENDPAAKWNEVRQIESTAHLLDVLHQIAALRTTIAVYRERHGAAFDVAAINTSEQNEPLFAVKLADTDGVVKNDPRHAGAWWGLLGLHELRPDVTVGAHPLRMPPGASTFMAAFQHLTTAARGRGPAGVREAPPGMIEFIKAQREAAGRGALRHIAITLSHLVHFNADELLHKYLLALRGHGADEPGHRHTHHLADLVARQSDVDHEATSDLVVDAFATMLDRFPQIFSATGSSSTSWPRMVMLHLHRWKVSTGNHRRALQWLGRRVSTANTSWADTARMAVRLRGTRETERTLSESVTDKITMLQRDVRSVSQQLRQAQEQTSSVERIEALTRARTEVRGWWEKYRVSRTEGRTDTDSTETEIDGSVGGSLWVVDLSGDLSRKSIDTLEKHLSRTIDYERERSGSTSDTTSRTSSESVTMAWRSLIELTRTIEREVTREVSRQRAYTQSVERVIAIADVEQQVTNVHEGITRYMER